jgi:hypothetical protein
MKLQGKIQQNTGCSDSENDDLIDGMKTGKKNQNEKHQEGSSKSGILCTKEELDLFLAGDKGKFFLCITYL